MREKHWRMIALIALQSSAAFSYWIAIPGSEIIPKLFAESDLVCKGEVTDAPLPVEVHHPLPTSPRSPFLTIQIRADRCFKGQLPNHLTSVRVKRIVTSPVDGLRADWGFVRKGDYALFFLK